MKTYKLFPLFMVMWFLLGCAHGEKWTVQDSFQITPTTRIEAWQQGASKDWYGGAVQGGQALVQYKRILRLTKEQVKMAWQKQFSHCPSDAQIYEVQKGWDDMIVWSEREGRYEEVVDIISTFSFSLQAPAPIILSAIIKAVADGASGILGPLFFAKFLKPNTTSVAQNVEGGNATGGTGQGGKGVGYGGKGGNAAAGATSGSVSGVVGGDGSVAGSVGGSTAVQAGGK